MSCGDIEWQLALHWHLRPPVSLAVLDSKHDGGSVPGSTYQMSAKSDNMRCIYCNL